MKIIKDASRIKLKNQINWYLLPTFYLNACFSGTVTIQFMWFNFIGTLSFLPDENYYTDPLLYSKEDFAEYIEKGEEAFLKEKLKR